MSGIGGDDEDALPDSSKLDSQTTARKTTWNNTAGDAALSNSTSFK